MTDQWCPCFLQGDRGHKGYKVSSSRPPNHHRDAVLSVAALKLNGKILPLSLEFSLIPSSVFDFPSQGDKGQRGNDGTDGRKVSYRPWHPISAALAIWLLRFIILFVSVVFLIRVKLVSLVFPAVKDLPEQTWVVHLNLRIIPLLWSCILASTGALLLLTSHIAYSMNHNQMETSH